MIGRPVSLDAFLNLRRDLERTNMEHAGYRLPVHVVQPVTKMTVEPWGLKWVRTYKFSTDRTQDEHSTYKSRFFFWNKIQLDLSLIRREENIRIVFIVHHWERYVKYNDVYSFEAQMTSEVLRHRFRTWFVLQPKMFSSCDALPYHWNPTSMAERVGLPPCNGSPTLNIFTHRFSVPSLVAMWEWRSDRWRCGWRIIPHVVALTELVATALDRQRWRTLSQSASSALEEERRHQAQSARERRHLAACIPATNANFQCQDSASPGAGVTTR